MYSNYDANAQNGADIVIGKEAQEIFVTEHNSVYCFLGTAEKDSFMAMQLGMWPQEMIGKHSNDKKFKNGPYKFYRLTEGRIIYSKYIDEEERETSCKKVDYYLSLPRSANIYFGVEKYFTHEEDAFLTRAVFGLTYSELRTALIAYSVATNPSDTTSVPRVTRSTKSSNYCSLSDEWIPAQFPYIKLTSNEDISLYSFYRLLQVLTKKDVQSDFSKKLMDNGVDLELLHRIFDIGKKQYWAKPVTNASLRANSNQ